MHVIRRPLKHTRLRDCVMLQGEPNRVSYSMLRNDQAVVLFPIMENLLLQADMYSPAQLGPPSISVAPFVRLSLTPSNDMERKARF